MNIHLRSHRSSFTSLVPFILTVAIYVLVAATPNLTAQDTFAPIRFEFDGNEVPSEWRPGLLPLGSRTVEGGSFIIGALDDNGASSVFDFGHSDLVAETQVRFLEDRSRVDWASISVRDPAAGGLQGYFGAVSSTGELLLARLTPGVGVDPSVRASANGFDALNQDLIMRLVSNGPTHELFAWPANDAMPTTPQLTLHDNTYPEGAFIGLGNTSFQYGTTPTPISFRYVEISPVPEPSAGMMMSFGASIAILGFRRRSVRLAERPTYRGFNK